MTPPLVRGNSFSCVSVRESRCYNVVGLAKEESLITKSAVKASLHNSSVTERGY